MCSLGFFLFCIGNTNLTCESVGHFTPSTNNVLVATNNVIKKKENALRELLPLSRFKALAFEVAEKWSKYYQGGLKQ